MSRFHLIRVGCLGTIGQFHSPEAVCYPRGARVIVRTRRGLEIGEVLAPGDEVPLNQADGALLRGMTVEDELLRVRLAKNRQRAYEACARQIAERGLSATLVDVEHLFDGRTLVFYFLGEITPELEAMTADLADTYDAQVKFRQFAETLVKGCGPECGTQEAAGCGSCSTGCGLAGACPSRAGSRVAPAM
jgi:cell fate regulator YaaT (PSP1 superfamily)